MYYTPRTTLFSSWITGLGRPSWIIVCDQFGLMHAPFAQARTFLSEHGFGETKVILHAEDGAVVVVKAKGWTQSTGAACPPNPKQVTKECKRAAQHHNEFWCVP